MDKPIIAVDIDDVLADSTESVRNVVNDLLGVALEPQHYHVSGEYEHYHKKIWELNSVPVTQEQHETLREQMRIDQSHVPSMQHAYEVLKRLKKQYGFIIVTARPMDRHDATHRWIDAKYPGIFDAIFFADGLEGEEHRNKGQICRDAGASWLIDDHIAHAQDALDEGLTAIVFGEYGWHYKGLPDNVVACKNWNEVARYFGV